MKTAAIASLAFGYLASAATVYTTDVVTEYTTYCPGPTTVVVGGGDHTLTVTEATVLTVW